MKQLRMASIMALHFSAMALSVAATPMSYQMKDGNSEPTLSNLKETIGQINTAFDTFKKTNDARLDELAKKGSSDPLLDEKMTKITDEITQLKTVREQVETLMKAAARPGGNGDLIDGEKFSPEQIEHQKAFEQHLRTRSRQSEDAVFLASKAVTTTTDSVGGHAVPEVISRRLNRELPEHSSMRSLVDVVKAGSKDYKELVDVGGMGFGWVGETDARPETGTPSLQEIAPTFGTIYAYPKASEESLDDMFFDVTNWLVKSGLEGFGKGESAAVINGNGTKKPTGMLNGLKTNEKDGTRAFGTLQFRASGAAAAIKSDAVRKVIYDLKKGYRGNARFLMNKATAGDVMVLKDGQGNYLWQPATTAGQPDKLVGYSVSENEEMPDVGADAFPIAFGDFKAGYLLVPLVGFRLTTDDNITEPGYVKYYLRQRLGGCLKKSEAIKLIKIAV